MFPFFSKVLTPFVSPPGLLILLLLLGLILGRRGRAIIAAAVVLLWVVATPLFSTWLAATLESQYPPMAMTALPVADVAIVLGGSLRQPLPPRLASDLTDYSDRVRYAAALYRAGKVKWILASGGNQPWQAAVVPESALVAELLVEFGVPADAIVQDPDSTTTRENALDSGKIVLQRGWARALLVTSAVHMPRAMATFLKLGIDVIPAATDVRAVDGAPALPFDLLPEAGALRLTSDAVKEWIGLVVYRFRGWA
jgi:uncharacterized SAM-binding protein YcdF (DUF218 family)